MVELTTLNATVLPLRDDDKLVVLRKNAADMSVVTMAELEASPGFQGGSPAAVTTALAVRVTALEAAYVAQRVAAEFVWPGTDHLPANGAVTLPLPFTLTLPGNAAGTLVTLDTLPAAVLTLLLQTVVGGTATTVSTLSIATNGALTLSNQPAVQITAGQALRLLLPANADTAATGLSVAVLLQKG